MEIKEEVKKVKQSAPLLAGMSEEKKEPCITGSSRSTAVCKRRDFCSKCTGYGTCRKRWHRSTGIEAS